MGAIGMSKRSNSGSLRGLLVVAALVSAVGISGSRALGQTAHPLPTTSPYRGLRYEEDWSFLKNQPKSADPLYQFKYIPLGIDDWYLTLGGDLREQYELYNQYPALAHTANPDAVKYRGAFEQRYQG